MDNLINVRDSLSHQLESLETKSNDLNKLSKIEQTTKEAYLKAGDHLSSERNKTSITKTVENFILKQKSFDLN